MKFFASLTN